MKENKYLAHFLDTEIFFMSNSYYECFDDLEDEEDIDHIYEIEEWNLLDPIESMKIYQYKDVHIRHCGRERWAVFINTITNEQTNITSELVFSFTSLSKTLVFIDKITKESFLEEKILSNYKQQIEDVENKRDRFLYVMQISTDAFKIGSCGYSEKALENRYKECQRWNPYSSLYQVYPGWSRSHETLIHHLLKSEQIKGEVFKVSAKTISVLGILGTLTNFYRKTENIEDYEKETFYQKITKKYNIQFQHI